MVSRLVLVTSIVGLCWAACGCAGGPPPPSVSSTVEGLVTLDGADLTEGGTVNFTSPSTGNAAIAMVGPDGRFVVLSGMVPGDYKVTLTPQGPTPQNPAPRESKIPTKYRSDKTSDLTTKISSGKNELKFELKS